MKLNDQILELKNQKDQLTLKIKELEEKQSKLIQLTTKDFVIDLITGQIINTPSFPTDKAQEYTDAGLTRNNIIQAQLVRKDILEHSKLLALRDQINNNCKYTPGLIQKNTEMFYIHQQLDNKKYSVTQSENGYRIAGNVYMDCATAIDICFILNNGKFSLFD